MKDVLRNLLLFALGVSIPLVALVAYQVYLDVRPLFGILLGLINAWVPVALWLFVVVLFADGYFHLKGE